MGIIPEEFDVEKLGEGVSLQQGRSPLCMGLLTWRHKICCNTVHGRLLLLLLMVMMVSPYE